MRARAGESSAMVGGTTLIVNALTFPPAFDEAGVGKDFEVVGDGCRGDSAEGHEFAADHFFIGGDGLENHEAGGVGPSPFKIFDTGAVPNTSMPASRRPRRARAK